jgi:fatty acid desaturase
VFMLTHELAHGSLGLPRWANELALAVTGLAMATSGHALRTMHLHHHAHPFADDDLEGFPARLPAHRALITAPPRAVILVRTAWRTAIPRDRRWQAAEHAGVALFAAAMLTAGPSGLQLYVAIAITAQLLAPFWAGHLIHHPPPRLVAIARPLARAGSLTARSLLVHDAHHANPTQPTVTLALPAASLADRPGLALHE